jgi:hypothetical protein
MDRTLRAVLVAAVIAFAAVAGLGVFLGFDADGSVLAGLVAALLAGLLLWAASRRAESFHPTSRRSSPASPAHPTAPTAPRRSAGGPSRALTAPATRRRHQPDRAPTDPTRTAPCPTSCPPSPPVPGTPGAHSRRPGRAGRRRHAAGRDRRRARRARGTGRDRGRDALVLPRLRDVGDRRPGPARRPGRAQAGAPPDPVLDGRDRPAPGPAVPQVRVRRRRRDEEVPPARRLGDLRRAGPDGPGLLDPLRADRRARQLRLGRRRPRGGDALHRVAPVPARDGAAARHRRGDRRPSRTTTATRRSRSSCRRGSRTCWRTARPASPSGWRPTSPRTTCAS